MNPQTDKKSPFLNRNNVAQRVSTDSVFIDQNETYKCFHCGQRMTRYYREEYQNGGWIRTGGFFQACFNPDCLNKRAVILEHHNELEHYRFRLI
ncbi:hypothetical protein A2403_02525 [Candidatus Roizmanbacteria bacterium RIFOXYC1_FULL_41_16]|nr:MAG: hypothetical protein A2612_01470 [Candidatus Moranbacteria bacterium RIFOXYD1_FULL_44_12]OGK71099.1 MAG: hypothetical protein A2403_02525 [Candidatus Roizmanbacteria bacterium RIFOXYC1_FULL_41_16]